MHDESPHFLLVLRDVTLHIDKVGSPSFGQTVILLCMLVTQYIPSSYSLCAVFGPLLLV